MDEIKFFPDMPGELLESWPKDENGQPEAPALLMGCMEHDMFSEMVISMLRAYEIPCFRVYPGDGAFGKLLLGMSGTGVELYVPESRLEAAKELLETEEKEND